MLVKLAVSKRSPSPRGPVGGANPVPLTRLLWSEQGTGYAPFLQPYPPGMARERGPGPRRRPPWPLPGPSRRASRPMGPGQPLGPRSPSLESLLRSDQGRGRRSPLRPQGFVVPITIQTCCCRDFPDPRAKSETQRED